MKKEMHAVSVTALRMHTKPPFKKVSSPDAEREDRANEVAA